MGGGGVIRAATKVAGLGVNRGFRGALQEKSATTAVAAKKSFSKPISESISTEKSQESNSVITCLSSESSNVKSASAIESPSWRIDDWEFTDGEEILLSESSPMPRVIFGGVPTLEEAEEATSELKDALDLEMNSSIVSNQHELESADTKACVISDTEVGFCSELKPVFQAFSLLKESPEAQSVVASLASDKNLWDAVLRNEKVMQFIKLHQTMNECHDDQASSKNFDDDEDDTKHSQASINVFMSSIQNIKFVVMDMMNNVAHFFQDLFGGRGPENVVSLDGNGNASAASNVDKAIGASFMGLAVMVIMVVLLKRG
ncbi:hypothetical protein MKW94_026315 [Papaver nudicaule]|uniref:Uncharacterized protein n=1 Tax=Papaver nudicaule TaxID=74823 RepID=A0AA41SH82_PAPNU|nr:hypothetical protein [Papaver nudicaule]